jgi:hypothetical protein
MKGTVPFIVFFPQCGSKGCDGRKLETYSNAAHKTEE